MLTKYKMTKDLGKEFHCEYLPLKLTDSEEKLYEELICFPAL